REKEEKEREMLRNNEQLTGQLEQMQQQLREKDLQIESIQQQQKLTHEMSAMLDNAYAEFNTLQEKIYRLEAQLTNAKMVNLEVEGFKEETQRLHKDVEEYRGKSNR